jgi:hypothetical protein
MGDHENLMFASMLSGMRRRPRRGDGDGGTGGRAAAIAALTALQGPQDEDPLVARFIEDHLQGRRQQEGFRQREREGETTYGRDLAARQYEARLKDWENQQGEVRGAPEREARLGQLGAATRAAEASTKLSERGLQEPADTRTPAEREAAAEARTLKQIKAESTAREYPEPPESAGGGAGGPRPMRRDEQMAYAQSVMETLAKLQAAGTIDDAEAKALAPRIMRGEQAAIERVLKAPDLEREQTAQDERRTLMDDAGKLLDASTPGAVMGALGLVGKGEMEPWNESGNVLEKAYRSKDADNPVERARLLQKAHPKFAKHGITAEELAAHYRKRFD